MTFGEHLDELRRALLKAVAALVLGVVVGFFFGRQLVAYIQTPLQGALYDHYSLVEQNQFRELLAQRQSDDVLTPAEVEAAVAEFAKQGLAVEVRLFDLRQVIASLRSAFPEFAELAAKSLPQDNSTPLKREDLIPLIIYHELEEDPRLQLVGLGAQEPFIAYMKAALVLGAVLSSPFVFYFIWQFVAAGLYPHEQRYVHIFLPFSIVLFLLGAALAFFVAFKYVLAFLLWFYETMSIDPELRISDWLSFVLILPLGFGVSFQLPLVMLFLERIGIFTVKTYTASWRIAVLVIAFIAMVLTPAEPYSMMFMAAPLVGLYFFGILLCRWMPRRTTPFGEVIG